MFSNNNRISTRQVFRLFVFDFVGESTLILPSQLAAFAGNDGLASIVLGGIMGSLYLWYLAYVLKKMETDLVTYMGTDSAGMDEKNFSGVTAGLFYRDGRIRGIYLFGRDTKGADCRGVVSPDSDSGIADGRVCCVWRD